MSNQPEPNLKQEFMKDFQNAQKDFPTMGKTKQVGVGKYAYSYLPLEQMLSLVTPVLLKNNISISQVFDYTPTGQTLLVTKLMHKNGHEELSKLPLYLPPRDLENPKKNQTHVWGGSVTYESRYSIKKILGIETDMDFNMEEEDKITDKKESEERKGVSHTPEKPDEKPDENYLLPKEINPDAKELIVRDLRNSPFKDQILKEFKSHFKLQVKEVTPANITLSEHGKFLRLTMEKQKDKS
mgnify:FL=1